MLTKRGAGKGYIALVNYSVAELVISVTFSIALPINVKRQTKATRQIINLILTKTEDIIISTCVAAYIAEIVNLYIMTQAVMNSIDIIFSKIYYFLDIGHWYQCS